MRLDKYLKVSRLIKRMKVTRIIKRRTVANNACDAAHVMVNGRPAKASYDVKVGDIIAITFGEKLLRVEVTDVKETVGKDLAATLYRVLE